MNAGKQVTAGMIVIGNEILSGRTKDKNIGFVAEQLTENGITMKEARVIPDDRRIIADTVNDFRGRFDYVFTSGGIGPTHDDITAESVALAFGREVELNKDAYDILLDYYGEADFTPARQRMCRMPEGVDALIPNPVSAAPGFTIENVHVMAGVPKIMQAMLGFVLPNLQGGDKVLSLTVSCMIPESKLAEGLAQLQTRYPQVDIGSYPSFKDGSFGVSVVARHTESSVLEELAPQLGALVMAQGGEPLTSGPV